MREQWYEDKKEEENITWKKSLSREKTKERRKEKDEKRKTNANEAIGCWKLCMCVEPLW